MKQKKVIVLGGNIPHIELINKLKAKGYYTVLVDYLDNPPAKAVADEHIKANAFDKDILLDVARQVAPFAIISICLDQPLRAAAYVAGQLGIHNIYDYETALNITDKVRMKRVMLDNDIPTSSFISVESIEDDKINHLEYPVVIKPSDSSGSKGVQKIYNREELQSSLSEALAASSKAEAIIEDYFIGKEFQIDCVVKQGDVHIVLVKQKIKFDENEISSPLGSYIPASIPDELRQLFKKTVSQISKVFGIVNDTLFVQVLLDKQEISVIEFAVRVGGGWSYKMIKNITGYDYLEAGMDAKLGMEISTPKVANHDHYMTVFLFANGTYDSIVGLEKLKIDGVVDDYDIMKSRGTVLNGKLANSNRLGIYMLSAKSKEQLVDKLYQSIGSIDILDSSGSSIFMKDVYEGAFQNIEKQLI